jgi:hypothetical protein
MIIRNTASAAIGTNASQRLLFVISYSYPVTGIEREMFNTINITI